jgi:acyl-coenzyme A synthetase/AMP-(fatty) acid ligase
VPERITVVVEFPRTSTGKIDRLRLRELAIAGRQPLVRT